MVMGSSRRVKKGASFYNTGKKKIFRRGLSDFSASLLKGLSLLNRELEGKNPFI